MREQFQFNYDLLTDWKELPIEDFKLVQVAYSAMDRAYAPYSEFLVGAALLMEDGTVVEGNNQENVAFPSGMCAERVALFYAGATYPKGVVKTICIVAKGALMPASFLLSPCGSCRQVLLESENRQRKAIRVIVVNQDMRTLVLDSAKDLLPFGFGK